MQNPANIIVTAYVVFGILAILISSLWIDDNPDEAREMGVRL